LVGTRRDNNSMLQLHGRIYELFRFIRGERDDRSQSAAHRAGDALGRLHRLLADFRPSYTPPTRSYHAASAMDEALQKIPGSVAAAEGGGEAAALEPCCEYLSHAYHEAARRADAEGLGAWPPRVLHGDWHPGNLLYRRGQVVAVLDFDSARMEPRMIDIANAALQFSMSAEPPDDPESWPDRLEAKRIRALIGGYDRAAEKPISDEEKRTLPWLLIEALVLESVIPIAATGRFGRVGGGAFLRMVERKIRWIRPRAEKLLAFLET
jgi:Ser/Thr protein kinase RdoA (MazF antagonist)